MRLKSFHGANVAEAMQRVRSALGREAIIVATHEDETGARITAAIDDDLQQPLPVAAHSAFIDDDPLSIIADSLLRHQVSAAWSEKILACATRYLDREPMQILAAALAVALSNTNDLKPSRVNMMIGAHGMGKTLSVARMAAAATMTKHKVAVISTDTERAGGIEQLEKLTRILDLRLLETDDSHALQDALNLVPRDNMVLIDTPGINPFNKDDMKAAALRINALGKNNSDGICLVLSAALDSNVARNLAEPMRELGARRAIISGIDLVRNMGSVIDIMGSICLPIVGISKSPRVNPFDEKPMMTIAEMMLPSSSRQVSKSAKTA